jgi:hypothetical protein
MLGDSLDLGRCVRADIVAHHSKICRINKPTCKEFGRDKSEPGAELLGYLIGTECHEIDDALTSDIGLPNNQRYHNDLKLPVAWIDGELSDDVDFTGPVTSRKDARDLVRAASLLLAFDQRDRARAVMSLIASTDIFDDALECILQKHFSLKGVKFLSR